SQKNLVINSDFDNAKTDNWTVEKSLYVSGSILYNGSNSLGINSTNTTDTSYHSAQSTKIASSVGKVYSFSAKGYIGSVGATNTGIALVTFEELNAAGNKLKNKDLWFDVSKKGVWQSLKFDGYKVENAATTHVRINIIYKGVINAYITQPMVVEAYTVGIYNQDTASNSQILLTQKDINLRVRKGDVLNQINISTEGILIDGRKVHITGQTSIDNAVIKDAMIATVKAGKITAGTINAANVNIINLNASNITAGVITGANLSINLQNGQVVFQKGRIHSTSNNIDINIDSGYVSVANDQARVLLKNGGIQMVQPNIFNEDKDPYLSIGNTGGIIGAHGANFVAKDYITMTNSKNQGGLNFPLGIEKMAGISFGYSGTWEITKIGGADRGVLLSGGHKMSSGLNGADLYGSSPNIIVGSGSGSGFAGNRVTINGEYVHIESAYRHTGSGSANVVVAADGALTRSTSASKYKTDITRSFETDYGGKLMNLPTATWTDIAETKRYMDEPLNQPKPTPNFGMIAEDLADAGLEMLVVRGLDGELEGINYDRIGPALIPVIAQLKNKIEELTHKMEETS
ncbi:gp58-like family protein, partial [Dellaglioa algida]|uniref:gp58-like family protein n=1 Tax=Dellaglioa algida TaxID=105612 RepID=UPI001CDB8CF2